MAPNGMVTNPSLDWSSLIHITGHGSLNDAPIDELVPLVINYYESIIACMPGHVYWLDKHARGVGCNKNVLELFGLNSKQQFKGLRIEQMASLGGWPKALLDQVKQDIQQVLETGVAQLNIEEAAVPHYDGRLITFLTHRVPLYDANKQIVGVVGISIDISERKKLEDELKSAKMAAETANKAKTEFLQNIHHDIRTPLTGIVNIAELIQNDNAVNNIHSHTQHLLASSRALLNLLDDIIETVKVSSGEIPLLRKKFNLQSTLEHIINLNQAKAHTKALRLTLDIDQRLPRYVIGDKMRLHRIILELVANALHFTKKGHVAVRAELAKQQERFVVIKFVITDSGIGIPKDKQSEIYQQFKRVAPSYQGIYQGGGLGLSVVKQFVEELYGEIYVQSEAGQGSTFTCLIPLQMSLLDDETGMDSPSDGMLNIKNESTPLAIDIK